MTSAGRPSPASAAAAALLRAFVDLGVTEFVVSPGSRSQALALAAAALHDAGHARVHVRIDERVGGFLALGLALETGVPAVVVTTSGTATANLHPAVLEAHHSNVPMIVLTADRPAELHGIRANQTTDQSGLYGSAIRLAIDVAAPVGAPEEADAMTRLAASVVDAATDEHVPGPVHVNLAYREPLSGTIAAASGIQDPEGPEDELPVPEPVEGHTSPVPGLVEGHTSPVPEPVEGRPADASTPFPGRPAIVLERGPAATTPRVRPSLPLLARAFRARTPPVRL